MQLERRLAAILAADVVGYSRLMGEDEAGTLARLKALRRELIDPKLAEFNGRLVKLMGDGALVEFASVVDAIRCAAAIQRAMAEHDQGVPDARRIPFRIGINLGDVIVEGDDLYGDGVNIAARLEALAEPGGICISGTAFDHAAHKAGVGFASLGEQRLKNIADPVRVYRVLLDPIAAGKVLAASRRPDARFLIVAVIGALLVAAVAIAILWMGHGPAPSGRPSVAVLPFANLSGDPKQDYFADGITEDLITDLAKLSGLIVIAHNSVLAVKGRAIDLTEVARALGVRFIVEGSVRRAGEQIRINAQLIDAATGSHVWADKFDRRAADVFAVENEIGREIVKALGLEPSASETERITRLPTANLEAYDVYLRGGEAARSGSPSGLREALALYERAQTLDPRFAEAFAADARTSVYSWRQTYDNVLLAPLARKRAYEKASRALELNPDLSLPYAILATLQVVNRRYEDAIASARRAAALGPGDATAHVVLGYVLAFAGDHENAVKAIETAMRLDPNLSAADSLDAGLVFMLAGDTERAIAILERARKEAGSVGEIRFLLAASYALAGRKDDARASIVEGLRLLPDNNLGAFRANNSHFRKAEDLATILAALRQAGLPDWPYGFKPNGRPQLAGEEISRLAFGHTWQGRLEPSEPAILQISRDGKTAFRSPFRIVIGTAYVDRNTLCEQSEYGLEVAACGPVFGAAGNAGKTEYTYVNSAKVFHFSPVD